MKKIIVLFTILFVACHAFAQEKISGYVEDSVRLCKQDLTEFPEA